MIPSADDALGTAREGAARRLRQDIVTQARLLLREGGTQARREIVRISLELGRLLEEKESSR